MSFTFPARFHSGDIPHDAAEAIIYALMCEVGKRFFSKGLIKFRNLNLKRKYLWVTIGSNCMVFLGLSHVEEFCKKIHFKKGEKICDKKMLDCFTNGISTFCKLEPQLTYIVFEYLEKFVTQVKVNKITGLDVYKF